MYFYKMNQTLHLLIDLTKRDFKVRYLGSVLGMYWNVVHPLLMILIYTLVFSKMMGARLGMSNEPFAYSLYLCCGLLAWNCFSETVNRCAVTLVDSSQFLKKISLPMHILFYTATLSSLLNFSIAFGIFTVILILLGKFSFAHILVYLLILLLFNVMAIGIGSAVGSLNVFMRDFQQLTSIVFQLWFWFTPIVYVKDGLPEFARDLLYLNPAFPFIDSMQSLLFYGKYPPSINIFLMFGYAAFFALIGVFVHIKSRSLIRDEL